MEQRHRGPILLCPRLIFCDSRGRLSAYSVRSFSATHKRAGLNYPLAARIVLLSGYYYLTLRPDVLVSSPRVIPEIGDLLRFTGSPLVTAAMLPPLFRKMFGHLVVPRRFADCFSDKLPVRPSQLRAESQDGVIMIPAVSAIHASVS